MMFNSILQFVPMDEFLTTILVVSSVAKVATEATKKVFNITDKVMMYTFALVYSLLICATLNVTLFVPVNLYVNVLGIIFAGAIGSLTSNVIHDIVSYINQLTKLRK
jgi:hypothetical protein